MSLLIVVRDPENGRMGVPGLPGGEPVLLERVAPGIARVTYRFWEPGVGTYEDSIVCREMTLEEFEEDRTRREEQHKQRAAESSERDKARERTVKAYYAAFVCLYLAILLCAVWLSQGGGPT